MRPIFSFSSILMITVSLTAIIFIPQVSHGVHDEIGSFHCVECHNKIPFKGVQVSYSKRLPLVCIRCHGDYHRGKGFLHPIGMSPALSIPKDFELGPNGEVTCITCHVFHPKESPIKNGRPTFLRRSSPKRLCLACHGSTLVGAKKRGNP